MDRRWRGEMEAILTGFKEWRQAHPRATLAEIEAARDARWAVARARLVADAALASAAADLRAVPPAQRPRCPDCGAVMEARGQEVRHLTTTHEQPLTLTRHRAVCPACEAGLSPLDEELGLLPGALTPRLQECAVRLGAWLPFRQAAARQGGGGGVCGAAGGRGRRAGGRRAAPPPARRRCW